MFLDIKPNSDNEGKNVTVSLYYQSVCPGCKDWVNEILVPTYKKMGKYLVIELVCYGNSRVRKF